MKVKIVRLVIDCPVPYLGKTGVVLGYTESGRLWIVFDDNSLGNGWFFESEIAKL